MNNPVRITTASRMFMAGPANAMISRCQRGLLKEAARVAGVLIARLFADHLHVAAEQHRGKPKIGLALVETEQPRAKSETERLHLHVEEARRPIMPELVDQDHDPDQDQGPEDVL